MPETTIKYGIAYNHHMNEPFPNNHNKAKTYSKHNDINEARNQLIISRQANPAHAFKIIEIITTESVLDD